MLAVLRGGFIAAFALALFVVFAQQTGSAQQYMPGHTPPPGSFTVDNTPPPTGTVNPGQTVTVGATPGCISEAANYANATAGAWGVWGGAAGSIANDVNHLAYAADISSWMQRALDVVQYIFLGLLGIQIIQEVADYMLETAGNGSLSGFMTRYAKMLLVNVTAFVIFFHAPGFITAAFSGASAAGVRITNTQQQPFLSDITDRTSFNPGALEVEGSCLARNMWTQSGTIYQNIANNTQTAIDDLPWSDVTQTGNNIGDVFRDIFDMISTVIITFASTIAGSLCIWLVFTMLALLYALVSLEVAFICGIGMISMGGLGHRAFHQLPTAFLTRCFGLLMKVVALGAIVGIGQFMVVDFENSIGNVGSNLDPLGATQTFIEMAITAICYYVAAVKIPNAVELTFSGMNASGFGSNIGVGGVAAKMLGAAKGAAGKAAARVAQASGSGKV